MKICKDSGLTIVRSIRILWAAQDRFFSPRLKNSNARSIDRIAAAENIEAIVDSRPTARA